MQVAARSLVEPFANEIVEREVRESARRASRIPGGRGAQNLAGVCKAKQLHDATLRVADRIEQLRETEWTEEGFRKRMAEEERRLSESLTNGRWKETFRGRDIWRKLVETIGDKYSYEVLKIEVVRQMQEVGFRPAGMAAVLESVGMVVGGRGKACSDHCLMSRVAESVRPDPWEPRAGNRPRPPDPSSRERRYLRLCRYSRRSAYGGPHDANRNATSRQSRKGGSPVTRQCTTETPKQSRIPLSSSVTAHATRKPNTDAEVQ